MKISVLKSFQILHWYKKDVKTRLRSKILTKSFRQNEGHPIVLHPSIPSVINNFA